jgi:outer membrane protein OmpA-like peptidoglycan-associated protein
VLYLGTALAALTTTSLRAEPTDGPINPRYEYDDSQSHPLRMLAYLGYPFGLLAEWTIERPLHRLASRTPTQQYIFGHKPHPPLFLEPQTDHDYGVNKRVPVQQTPPPRVTSQEPIAEKVLIKAVPVEKTVVREVTKVVEVEKIVFPDVAFEFNSAQLTDLGKGQVYLAAQKLKEKSEITVVIEGHTDHVGSETYNQKLGMLRAEVVKQELTRLGVDSNRMSVTSLGETRSLLEEQTDWARAVNRRAEFRVSSR